MRFTFALLCLALIPGCSRPVSDPTPPGVDRTVTINVNDVKQTIQNFGASDAWCIQHLGRWPDQKRGQVAEWLFSTENDSEGKPKGVGLSLWRFNIGAGSMPQKNIADEWRSTEGFLTGDMTYDWSKQAGQRWFASAAKSYGVPFLVGFTNSPPVQLTKNGRAFSGNGEEANIAPENHKAFAGFLADVAQHMKEEGTPFNYLSPFNEPQWDWTGNGQEGSPYRNSEIFSITKALDSTLAARGLPIKIQVGEAGKLNYLYEKADKATRGQQIREFFDAASPLYMGNLSHVDRVISGHSYFTSAPVQTLKAVRESVSSALTTASVPIEFWQTEYCVLGDQEEIPAVGKDTGIVPGLYVARIIHHDLTVANASAWHWWLSVSAYDYKDGLIYMDKNEIDGNVEDTKLLWSIGNYSRFIRPGSVRLGLTSALNINDPDGIMISSYLNPDTREVITIIINYGRFLTDVALVLNGGEIDSWQPYLTASGEDENLKPLDEVSADGLVSIRGRSIITLVGKLK